MKQITFEGFYKGGRDYLHGTDLYNYSNAAVTNYYGDAAFVKSIMIRSVARNTGSFFVDCEEAPEGFQETAQFRIQNGDNVINGLFATDGGIVQENREYDESLVEGTAEISANEKRIEQLTKTAFTPCEEIVGLTKYLHNSILMPKNGKWMFTMLDLKESILNFHKENFAIVLRQNLGGKMTRSNILVNNNVIGTIGFTVMQL